MMDCDEMMETRIRKHGERGREAEWRIKHGAGTVAIPPEPAVGVESCRISHEGRVRRDSFTRKTLGRRHPNVF